MNKLAVVGAGGHGRVVADLAEMLGCYSAINFFDDFKPKGSLSGNWQVVGNIDNLIKEKKQYSHIALGLGDNGLRKNVFLKLKQNGCKLINLIHPNALLSPSVTLGEGNVICAGVVLNAFVKVGDACIINTRSSIDHDSNLMDFSHVSPAACVAGSVEVGRLSWIGMGALIKNNLIIGEAVTVGMGAVVTKNIAPNQTVIGCPAKAISKI